MYKESETLEFKRGQNETIEQEVIAFANTRGGTIIIGYNDNGTLNGVENVDKVFDNVCNRIRNAIEPDVSFLISARKEVEDSKDIIVIDVLQGTKKPYYLKKKGMVPDGVFIRVGATSPHATSENIKDMIIESAGLTFEKNISNNQNLTFEYADKVFKDNNLKFGRVEKKNLGLINEFNMYTNLGLLLSDQCPYTIKMAVYPDNTKVSFLDTKETEVGSILKQVSEAEDYLKLNNKINAEIVGFERIETPDYNQSILRECLYNAVGHRDYEMDTSTFIHIFKDYIEFLNLGSLVKGLTLEDIMKGSSISRNPKLVSIFHRLNLVEAYGTGIPRIMESYDLCVNKPEIEVLPNSFIIRVPKISYDKDISAIIEYAKHHDTFIRTDIEQNLKIGRTKTLELLNKLVDNKLIIKDGSSTAIRYKYNKYRAN